MAVFRVINLIVLFGAFLSLPPGQTLATDGSNIITVTSADDFDATMNRLEASLAAKGLMLFAKIDHAGGAARVGQSLRPTTVFIFGSPKVGTPVIDADQRTGLDLPMRMVVYVGEDGKTHITYRHPAAMLEDWTIDADLAALTAMTKGLAAIADDAAGRGD